MDEIYNIIIHVYIKFIPNIRVKIICFAFETAFFKL